MSREELIRKIMWNSGGYGFGICSMASSMLWAMDQPGPGKPDLPSVVAVSGPPEKYTDAELERLVRFSEERTVDYDRMFNVRRGANLILIDKISAEGNCWMRKRLSWEFGPMHSPTLEEAVTVFERN